ncbi:MAG: diaminopimelate decarboxylase, partial [Actinobacteria bacterium]
MADPIDRGLLPESTVLSPGATSIGGCDLLGLAAEYGTPLFVYDEQQLRDRCREAVAAFGDGVAYATKAFLCTAMARLAWEEGMCLDVATGGEAFVALHAGVPSDRLVLHGNNKSVAELDMALRRSVRRVVIDSFAEIERIEALVSGGAPPPRALIRVNPGVDAHTHEYLATAGADSKFGFALRSGEAEAAVARVSASASLDLIGIHLHVGSQVLDISSFSRAISEVGSFVAGLRLPELSIGGGLGVAYNAGERAPSITEWAAAVTAACRAAGI